MDCLNIGVELVALVDSSKNAALVELSDVQLALIGGGAGDVTLL